jgi:pimeloyl-ACP methyl ester carboxylesterase
MAVVLVHLFDDAIVDAPRGTSLGSNLATVAVPAAVAVVAAVGFTRLRPGVQAWVAATFGAIMTAVGALNIQHALRIGGTSGSDITGIAVCVAGVGTLLVGIALVLRPKGARTWPRRWAARAGALAGSIVTGVFVVLPIAVGVYLVDKQPVHVPTTSWSVPHRDVTLHTSDRLDLAAWYAPSRNGATIILVHGSGGSRAGGIKSRATMLANAGYGVLVYDARGSGDSEGRPESLGWTWHRDLEAAVNWLAARKITNVGVLGLSTGAVVALETAGDEPRIKAVVAEGAEARTFTEVKELPLTLSNLFAASYSTAMFTVHHVLSHTSSPPALKKQVVKIGSRPLFLISSGTGYERDLTRVYYRAAAGPKTLWEMPHAAHTGGLSEYPQEYPRRVDAFFAKALSVNNP